MFKILLIGLKTGCSDEKLEFVLTDSLSLKRFLGLGMDAPAPDLTTIARYRSAFDPDGVREVFELVHDQLEAQGYEAKDGQMLDSTFILVPVQRHTRDENQTLKDDAVPAAWQEDDATAKLRQKDTDARWTKKHRKSFFWYKHHVCVDVKHKLVLGDATTSAKDHDITVMLDLVDPTQKGSRLYADAAYRAEAEGKALRAAGIKSRVMFKRSKGKDLTSYQQRENRTRAKTRARVEHVFGSMQNELGGKVIRTIGFGRAATQVGLTNLLYNLHRYMYLEGVRAP